MPSVPWEVRSAVLGWPWAKPAAVAAVVPNWKMSLGMEETILASVVSLGWVGEMECLLYWCSGCRGDPALDVRRCSEVAVGDENG